MKAVILLLSITIASLSNSVFANTPQKGKMTGGIMHSLPGWFKQSFLNFNDDVDEAKEEARHILMFMDLNGCPYCTRMLRENFHKGETMEFIKKHFDSIGVNVRGSREVTWIDQKTYTEKELALKMKVVGTPTMVFISPEGKKVLQLNGYRTPKTFRYALEYVQSKTYKKQSLSDYIETRQKKAVYTFRSHPRFEKVTNFSGYKKLLAVVFEDKNCADCDGFHNTVFNHPDVLEELKPYRVVRLDAYSSSPIVDINGKKTTPRKWASSLKLSHRPGIVFFDEGKEASRLEGRFYHFHFKEMLRFVSGKHYQHFDRFGAYLQDRQPKLLEQGVNIYLGE